MLPLALIVLVDTNTPLTMTLPPVTLPVALTVAPLCTALALPIVAAFTVAAYTVPVPLTAPAPYKILPPVILPLACTVPETLSPAVETTTTFDVPPIVIFALPPEVPILASLVPLNILLALNPVIKVPFPSK